MQQVATQQVEAHPAALLSFLGYLAVVVGVGLYARGFSSRGVSEFFVGGRRMHRFVVALSAVVSGRSAWLLLGVTGMAYAQGASAAWAVTGYIVVELLLFIFYAGRLRRFSEAFDCVTIPDFFAARFADRNGSLRLLLVSIILVFMVAYVSSQFVGGGKALAASFPVSQTSGLLLTALIVLLYTTLGGFLAVSLTDMLQAMFMIVALVVLPFVAITDRGGLTTVLQELRTLDPTLIDPYALSFGAAIGFLGIGLGSPGNPHILVRYMSIADAQQFRYSAVVGTVWNVVMAWGALFVGLVGRLYFPDASMLPAADTENLYPTLAQQQLHPVLFGIVVASIFAAIMSTADSQLLVAASSVVRDVYQKVIYRDRDISETLLVRYSRVIVVTLVLISVIVGHLAEELVFWLVLFAWAGLGAALGPVSILALFWRRTTKHGVAAGMLTGAATTVVWENSTTLGPLLYELIPAFGAGLLAAVLVSYLTRRPAQVDTMFDQMVKPGGEGP